jgi:hypothetical protein
MWDEEFYNKGLWLIEENSPCIVVTASTGVKQIS